MYPPFTPSFTHINTSSSLPWETVLFGQPPPCLQYGGVVLADSHPASPPPTWHPINKPDDDSVESVYDVSGDDDGGNSTSNFFQTTSSASTSYVSRWFPFPLETYNCFRLIVDIGLVGSLCLFGFIGNGLTIMTLKLDSRDRKRTTNWLLQVLAVLDILYLAAALMSQPYQTLSQLTYLKAAASKNEVTLVLVDMVMPYVELVARIIRSVSQTAIVWVVVLVTLDRYVAVCRPLLAVEIRTVRHAQRAVIGVAIAAIVYNIPLIFEKKIVTAINPCTGRPIARAEMTQLKGNLIYFLAYRTVCYIVLRSVGPLVLLIVLNTRLAVALQMVHSRRKQLEARRAGSQISSATPATPGCAVVGGGGTVSRNGNRKPRKKRENLTLMLVVVVSVFVVCEVPDVCLRLIVTALELVDVGLTVEVQNSMRYLNVVATAFHTVNSSVNFLVYCLLGRKFRRILLRRVAVACHSAVELSSVATAGNGAGNGANDAPAGPVALSAIPGPIYPPADEIRVNGQPPSVTADILHHQSSGSATMAKPTKSSEMRSYCNLKKYGTGGDTTKALNATKTAIVLHRPLGPCLSV